MHAFENPLKACRYAFRHPPDAVYAASALHPLDGHSLNRLLRRQYPGLKTYLIRQTVQ